MSICIRHILIALGCLGVCAGLTWAQTSDKIPPTNANLVVNGGFEKGMEGWGALWTREPGTGVTDLNVERHSGARAIRVKHTGNQDWSLGQSLQLKVKPGEIFELSAWIRLDGKGNATLSVITQNANGEVVNWNYGGQSVRETKGWRPLQTRFIIPRDIASIQCRLTGNSQATVWLDDVVLTRENHLDTLRNSALPATLSLQNASLEVTLHTADATMEMRDRRTGRSWAQQMEETALIVLDAHVKDGTLNLRLLNPLSMRELAATVRLEPTRTECVVTLKGCGEMKNTLLWPLPFATAKGQQLILPVNEGISYPVDDPSLPAMNYSLYSGHGLCMPWYGTVDGTEGWMAIVETPDDAHVRIHRKANRLVLVPEWLPQKRCFGPERVIRYIVFNHGGYVAMAKRYREYAKRTGLFKTLAEKRKAVPAVDLLVGAVNVWCWDTGAPALCREMQSMGIRRILWSHRGTPGELKSLNDMGVLTSRYDIYQDAMNPENFPDLPWIHPDWTSEAWKNDDLMVDANGNWVRGWQVETKRGEMIPCGTLCDRQAVAYARKRIPKELATHPYRCRFLDTTTASSWRECYHPKHPMTRTQSKQFKMDLLRYVSEELNLVCGSETGHDAAVPHTHYFEGMLSLGPYRVPDAGRNIMRVWDNVPERVAKFQTGHVYRLPLWELVYHDCVVAQWYWGDYNNKLPELWNRRDLWNALYGTPPMFMFDRERWKANKDRFVQSYETATPVARATGYVEMLSHEWLTVDHAVQQTQFANGVVVTANFGDTSYTLSNGVTLPPLGHRVDGIQAD